jgi:hypothetical protein
MSGINVFLIIVFAFLGILAIALITIGISNMCCTKLSEDDDLEKSNMPF